jgi:hypothetical protein
MPRINVTGGHMPGAIGAIVSLYAKHYAGGLDLGLAFEAKIATELSAFLLAMDSTRDLFLLANVHGTIAGSIAVDGHTSRVGEAPAVWTSPDAQHRLIFDILSGRGGLNHGWVTKDVGWRSLAERFGLNLLTQECYHVLAGGTPSGIAPLG